MVNPAGVTTTRSENPISTGVRLAIVGSVSLADNPSAAQIIQDVLGRLAPVCVISGGAAGIDTMAADAARLRGWDLVEYLPETRRWHDGFMPRNLLIARDCEGLVRIVAHDSTTYGSGWTRDRAAEMGKPWEEFVVVRDA